LRSRPGPSPTVFLLLVVFCSFAFPQCTRPPKSSRKPSPNAPARQKAVVKTDSCWHLSCSSISLHLPPPLSLPPSLPTPHHALLCFASNMIYLRVCVYKYMHRYIICIHIYIHICVISVYPLNNLIIPPPSSLFFETAGTGPPFAQTPTQVPPPPLSLSLHLLPPVLCLYLLISSSHLPASL
jgi:hypothetical protein